MATVDSVRRGIAVVVLIVAAASLGSALAFWRTGPEMVIMTLIFGGSGIYLFVQGLGLLILRPPPRTSKQLDDGNSVEQHERQQDSRAA